MKGKVLVTGGAGYIGSHTIVQLLNAGFDVVAVDNFSKSDRTLLDGIGRITQKPFEFIEADCLNMGEMESVFKKHQPKTVIHFAAFKAVGESVHQPMMYYRNNIGSLQVILDCMKKFGVKDIIFSSSCTVYGQPDQIPVTEKTPFKPAESPYGATKQICEQILKDVIIEGFRVVSLRYFNPIGAHPTAMIGELPLGTPNNLVPYITQTAAGIRKELTIFGDDYSTEDGTCVRDYIHVVDLAQGHVDAVAFLARSKAPTIHEVFNLGTGKGDSVLEVVKKFESATGVKCKFVIGPRRSGDIEKIFANVTKANQVLGWKTKFTLEDALKHAWAWQEKLLK